ncbi:MAG TPA: glycosyltransferase family 2 protein [Candidatus Lokiarchaeia archaeon]|nr:glycosyltransferase family 2 protein [Candidatus Lokiarchaeia archaeon]
MKFTIVIPAHNEEKNIKICVMKVEDAVKWYDHEIIIVNDGSLDGTQWEAEKLVSGCVSLINRQIGDNGFGKAVAAGIRAATGDFVVPVMADLSDETKDITRMIRLAQTGRFDVIAGNRFTKQSLITGYPQIKLLANRLFNHLVSVLFKVSYKDLSNAFKMYSTSFLRSITITAKDFDLTIELPLKALIKGMRFAEIPNNWYGRKAGSPKWKLLKVSRVYFNRLFGLYRVWRKLNKKK